jgi:hypothetical protein
VKGPPDAGLIGAHDVAISVRKGVLATTLDGVPALTGPVATDFDGWLGIIAGTGGNVAIFSIRNFAVRYWDCDDP